MNDSTGKDTENTEETLEDQAIEEAEVIGEEVSEEAEDVAQESEETADDAVEAEPESLPEDEEIYEEVVEERSTNWAARLLFWLVLLFAGAAGALWGGPKLAPQLPEWAAPVAKFLTPGGDAALKEAQSIRADVEAGQADLDARLATIPDAAALEASASTAATEASAQAVAEAEARISDAQAQLQDQIAALEEAVANVGPNEEVVAGIDALSGRMEEIESRLGTLNADVAGLSETLSAAAIEGGEISADTMADIAANATRMASIQNGLQTLTGDVSSLSGDMSALSGDMSALTGELSTLSGDLAGLSGGVDGLSTRMDTLEGETLAKAEAAEAAATEQARLNAVENELDAIRKAIVAGQPFDGPLATLGELGITSIPDALSGAADGSIATTGMLKAELAPLARQAIRLSIRSSADDSPTGRLGAFLQSRVAGRSLEPGEGDSADAVLSRMDAALSNDNLSAVTEEAAALPEAAQSLLAPWMGKVEARQGAFDAIEAIAAGS